MWLVEGNEKGTQCLGYNSATLSLGDINTGTWSSRLGLDTRRTALLCKKIIVVRSKEVKARWCNSRQSWQNFLRKAMAQNRAVLPMMNMDMRAHNRYNLKKTCRV
jgi:hypothetical protein